MHVAFVTWLPFPFSYDRLEHRDLDRRPVRPQTTDRNLTSSSTYNSINIVIATTNFVSFPASHAPLENQTLRYVRTQLKSGDFPLMSLSMQNMAKHPPSASTPLTYCSSYNTRLRPDQPLE